jgi:hypothetical protein
LCAARKARPRIASLASAGIARDFHRVLPGKIHTRSIFDVHAERRATAGWVLLTTRRLCHIERSLLARADAAHELRTAAIRLVRDGDAVVGGQARAIELWEVWRRAGALDAALP